jgi:ribose transport system permease protein
MSDPSEGKVDVSRSGPGRAKGAARRVWRFVAREPLPWVLVALVALVSVLDPTFLRPDNVLAVLQNASIVGIVAVGMTFVIVGGGIDLSVGSLVAMAGAFGVLVANTIIDAEAICAAMGDHSGPAATAPYSQVRVVFAHWVRATGLAGGVGVAVAAGFVSFLLLGTLGGLINGLLIAKGRVAAFIVTLGGLAAYRSVCKALTGSGEIKAMGGEAFTAIGNRGIPIPFLTNQYGRAALELHWSTVMLLVSVIVGHVVLTRTRFGRYVVALGANEQAARYSAVRVDRVRLLTYVLLGGLCGLAALLQASRLGGIASGSTGVMWELDAIAAVVIGGTRLNGGYGRVWGTLVGLLILAVVENMLILLQVPNELQGLVKGVIIVGAVLLQRPRRGE